MKEPISGGVGGQFNLQRLVTNLGMLTESKYYSRSKEYFGALCPYLEQ